MARRRQHRRNRGISFGDVAVVAAIVGGVVYLKHRLTAQPAYRYDSSGNLREVFVPYGTDPSKVDLGGLRNPPPGAGTR